MSYLTKLTFQKILPSGYNDPRSLYGTSWISYNLAELFASGTFYPEHLRGVWFHKGERLDEAT